MDNELKPCPFCGGEARVVYYNDENVKCCAEEEEDTPAFVHCYGCDMDYIPSTDTPSKVTKEWNRRAVDSVN